jgi:nucleoside-diphosphate-sugar epimerase
MRVVVTGATGNVGTSVIDAFSRDPPIESIVGIARRIPDIRPPKVRWLALDVRNGVRRGVAVVRLRKALVFKREAASEIRRLFLGPLFPASLLRPRFVPVFPALERLRFQVVHSRDAGEAYRLAVTRGVRGAFNVAAEPVIDSERLARIFDARRISVPPALVRAGLTFSWKLHLQPTSPGWWDMALGSPLMDTTRARTELGWQPSVDAEQSLCELIDGLRAGDGMATPPLAAGSAGLLRSKEFASGVGSSAAP